MKTFVDIGDIASEAIKKTLSVLFSLEFVDSAEEANLVITDSVNKIGDKIDEDKRYIVININNNKIDSLNLPSNVFIVPLVSSFTQAAKIINDMKRDLETFKETFREELNSFYASASCEDPGKYSNLRILVVDDKNLHRKAARVQFRGALLLQIVSSYEEAFLALGNEAYDVVLSDLHLPMSPQTLSERAFRLGEQVPYGLLIALKALEHGIAYIGVVTDINHHQDAISAAFDRFPTTIEVDSSKIRLIHASLNPNGCKDWAAAANLLLE